MENSVIEAVAKSRLTYIEWAIILNTYRDNDSYTEAEFDSSFADDADEEDPKFRYLKRELRLALSSLSKRRYIIFKGTDTSQWSLTRRGRLLGRRLDNDWLAISRRVIRNRDR